MNVYSRSFIITIFIFLIGLMLGFFIDNMRINEVKVGLRENEIVWEDSRLLSMYISQIGGEECEVALEENLAYNDRIYEYGRDIEEKLESTTFTPEAKQEWRRYILLQFQFWLNSVELKEKCDFNYSNVIYLWRKGNETSTSEEVENKLQSTVLLDLKEKCGRNMMLIPLTADADLECVDLLIKQHNITRYPAVIIDEEYVFQGFTKMGYLEDRIRC